MKELIAGGSIVKLILIESKKKQLFWKEELARTDLSDFDTRASFAVGKVNLVCTQQKVCLLMQTTIECRGKL